MILPDYSFDACQLVSPQSTWHYKDHRIQPELGDVIVALDMYMGRFAPISRIEEKAEWPLSQD